MASNHIKEIKREVIKNFIIKMKILRTFMEYELNKPIIVDFKPLPL